MPPRGRDAEEFCGVRSGGGPESYHVVISSDETHDVHFDVRDRGTEVVDETGTAGGPPEFGGRMIDHALVSNIVDYPSSPFATIRVRYVVIASRLRSADMHRPFRPEALSLPIGHCRYPTR